MAAAGDLAIVLPAPAVKLAGTYTGTTPTDTSNAADGIIVLGGGTLTWMPAVVAPARQLASKFDKAVAYPAPTMVNGRPT